ncbi:MAG: MogA/MoaB family molybdenum cofactor biosynthesis protein [Chloroflexi bacterium]|nr:MogA/MoaB family molybdenum cofactor biosynthesis protein [Chloroflexota bacterium]
MYTLGVLTISDASARGQRQDTSGQAIREVMGAAGYQVRRYAVVPDDPDAIVRHLEAWSAEVDLVLTTGGTGLGPRDVTPEATLKAVERLVPGIPEAMRQETARQTPMAWLSRAVAGTRGQCLVINLPGSPRAVRECLGVVLPLLPHALDILKDTTREHPVPPPSLA